MRVVLVVKLLEVYPNMLNRVEVWWVWGPILQYFHIMILQPCHSQSCCMHLCIVLHKDCTNAFFFQFLQEIQQRKFQSPNLYPCINSTTFLYSYTIKCTLKPTSKTSSYHSLDSSWLPNTLHTLWKLLFFCSSKNPLYIWIWRFFHTAFITPYYPLPLLHCPMPMLKAPLVSPPCLMRC